VRLTAAAAYLGADGDARHRDVALIEAVAIGAGTGGTRTAAGARAQQRARTGVARTFRGSGGALMNSKRLGLGIGNAQVRFAKLDGDLLTLSTKPMTFNGVERRAALVSERVGHD
jgi:hypothetical protein